MSELPLRDHEPLAPRTTLAVGGPARHFVEVADAAMLAVALLRARSEGWEVLILGGGSNLLIADAGFDGLVISLTDTRLEVLERTDHEIRIAVGAGHCWDELVATCVDEGWAGIECLSGIPGLVGAAPIQNIGAYGQEVAECIAAVHVMRRSDCSVQRFDADACAFGYRHSHFKGAWRGDFVVLSVELRLRLGAPAALRYGELTHRLGSPDGHSLVSIREAVLELRAAKSMVYYTRDPNHRSAGSFFVNPIVPASDLDAIVARLAAKGIDAASMPRYSVSESERGGDVVKLSAAWLIERAGFSKGLIDGNVGLSTCHCLALINRGEASADDLLRLARRIRDGVEAAFGVRLVPEPAMVGVEFG